MMGVLIGVLGLATAILLTLALVAWIARWARPGWRLAAFLLVQGILILKLASFAAVSGWLWTQRAIGPTWFVYVLFMLAVVLGLVVWTWPRFRRIREGESLPPAASWPAGRLGIALLISVALLEITFWNTDLGVRQRLGVLRAEAGAMAMSLAPPRVPDRDNAALIYQQAFELMGPIKEWDKQWREQLDRWLKPAQAGFDPKDPAVRGFLDRHASALALLRQAAAKGGCYFQREYNRPSINMLLPEPAGMRQASQLLAVSARARAAAGDVRGALADAAGLFALADHAAAGPGLIMMLVGANVDATAKDTLEAVLAAGPAAPEDLAAVRVEPAASYRLALERAIIMEEAFRLACFAAMDGEQGLDLLSLGTDEPLGCAPRAVAAIVAPLYRVFLLDGDLAVHNRLSRQYRELAAKPYHESRPGWTEVNVRFARGRMGVLTAMLVPGLSAAAERAARGDAYRRVVTTALAACRYRAKHERLPQKLDDLAPEFLPAVPVDPFDGKPLRCRRTERGLVIYSVGPNLSDDGGARYDRQKETSDIAFELRG